MKETALHTLLSGFLGAILGAAITIAYMYFSDKLKRRYATAIAVQAHVDKTFKTLVDLLRVRRSPVTLSEFPSPEEAHRFRVLMGETLALCSMSEPRVRMGLEFGDTPMFYLAGSVLDKMRDAANMLDRWEHPRNVMEFIEKEIDPLSRELAVKFVYEARFATVFGSWFPQWCRDLLRIAKID